MGEWSKVRVQRQKAYIYDTISQDRQRGNLKHGGSSSHVGYDQR